MKIRIGLIIVLATIALGVTSCGLKSNAGNNKDKRVAKVTNPLPVKLGNPYLLHANDGNYYMYGTSLTDGFEVYMTSDFNKWQECGQVYKGGGDAQWNTDNFMAPVVYEKNGKYYLFYSANSKNSNLASQGSQKIGVAVSLSPIGPFSDLYNRPIFDPGYSVTDADVYFDKTTGQAYLYYTRCENAGKTVYGEIYGVELKSDFSGVIGVPQSLIAPPGNDANEYDEWEVSASEDKQRREINNGPSVFKNGDTYYMLYSANNPNSPFYAIGYATSKYPLGPFKKAKNNPILCGNQSKGGSVIGVGQCMSVAMVDGRLYCVYHVNIANSSQEKMIMIDRMIIDRDGTLTICGPSAETQEIKY